MTHWGLPRPISDHCPIMISNSNWDWVPKPYRFLDVWLSHPKCLKLAKEAWDGTATYGWAGCQIVKKLKGVKKELKKWNKREFGNVNTRVQGIQNELHQLDILSETRCLNPDEKKKRGELKGELWTCSKLVESI